MRLLFVSHSLPPEGRSLDNLGGMQRVAADLYETLQTHPGVELSGMVLRSSWTWIHVRVGPYLARTAAALWRRARREEVDVILFSSMVTAMLAVPLRRTLKAHGVKTAAIVHGLDITTPFAPFQWFLPKVFDALDMVCPVSRATGEECLARGLPPEKLNVVPNGIHITTYPDGHRAEARTALARLSPSLPDDAFLLSSVGRQVERKGFDWFIEHVMPRLPARFHYWLAGDGPMRETIEAAIDKHALGDRVRLLGRVSEEHLDLLYRGSDLYVMPNVPVAGDMEGFGVVMLEAGLGGLPTVASNIEGIRDVIRDGVNGWLVPTQDAEAFVDAILAYADDASPAEAAERTARYVADTFSWPAVTDQYVNALASLIAE